MISCRLKASLLYHPPIYRKRDWDKIVTLSKFIQGAFFQCKLNLNERKHQ